MTEESLKLAKEIGLLFIDATALPSDHEKFKRALHRSAILISTKRGAAISARPAGALSEEDQLIIGLGEEAVEVALALSIRCSKALRFTMEEIQPEQEATNRERIQTELDDLYTLAVMLGFTPKFSPEKEAKVRRFMAYSNKVRASAYADDEEKTDPGAQTEEAVGEVKV